MAFMILLLAVLLGLTVWYFFQLNPKGAPVRALLLYNVAVFLLAIPSGAAAGWKLFADAMVVRGNHAGMPMYLAVMAGGTVFLIILAIGGMVRNFFVFPAHRRTPASEQH
ncbi:MAG TPA: hypothetical protein PLM09_05435 [Casimicrobiaceae bacterium]|nr:hypothetical protein [Casimicrobiaceae bacterium]